MHENNVKTLYSLGHAGWYDPFKKIWNILSSSKAEKEFTSFLKDTIDETKTILDLGCGTGLNLEKIHSLKLKFKKYLGLDFSKDMLDIAKNKFAHAPRVEFKQKDITNLNDIAEKFDVIICTWVLSHLQSPSSVVNQAQKSLAPDGKMFLIFFSKPRWYINVWLYFPAKYIFQTKPLTEVEVNKFKNVKTRHKYSGHITSTVTIQ